MTAPDLSAIRAQMAGITPGPWLHYGDLGHEVFANTGVEDEEPTIAFDIARVQDAAFIAAAPSTVERLLGIVERVESQVKATEELAEIVAGEDLQAGLRLVARGIRAAITGEGRE